MENQPETQTHNNNDNNEEDETAEEVEKLEEEVNQMAHKIIEYRSTLPLHFKTTLSSILASQRPILYALPELGSEPGPSHLLDPGNGTLLAEDQETADKIHLLKRKISSNTSAMPLVLKRMKECMTKIDTLDSFNGIIHPAFKRKRPS